MANFYYYLVTGLPDIVLDEERNLVPFGGVADEAAGIVEAEDAALIRYIRHPFDNANLMKVLGEGGSRSFDDRGCFSEMELIDIVKTGDGEIPDYMHTFLTARKEGREIVPGLSAEDTLATLFCEEVCDHSNAFIREYFTFERDLRNVLAAQNVRFLCTKDPTIDQRALLERSIIGHDEIAQTILKSTASDFSLSGTLPWAAQLFSVDDANVVGREKKIDLLRWEFASDLSGFTGFQIETVLGFLVKMAIAHRWAKLDGATGREMFDSLLLELKAGISIEG